MQYEYFSGTENIKTIRRVKTDENGVEKLHSPDDILPSMVSYRYNGSIQGIFYHQNGKAHRVDSSKPTIFLYYESGSIKEELWVSNGAFHRLDGPSQLSYDEDGNIIGKRYHFNGVVIDSDVFIGIEEGSPEFIFTMSMIT